MVINGAAHNVRMLNHVYTRFGMLNPADFGANAIQQLHQEAQLQFKASSFFNQHIAEIQKPPPWSCVNSEAVVIFLQKFQTP